MIRRLDRYVFKEMLVPFIAGSLIVALLFETNAYIYLAKSFNVENIPLLARAQWLLYQLPSYLKLTLPTGMALSAALSIGRMARESEVTALRAAGTPVMRILRPVLFFGLLAGALNFTIVDRIIPICAKKVRELEAKNALLGLAPSDKTFKANAFIQLDRYAASLGGIRRTPDDKLVINDAMLIERAGGNVVTIVVAPIATYDAGLWDFQRAHIYHVDGLDMTPVAGDEIRIDQTSDLDALFTAGTSNIGANDEEKPPDELRLAIDPPRREKGDPRRYEIELYSRSASGVACAVFAFTSAVFAVHFSRSGGFAGLLVSFSVCVLYYNAYVVSVQILGRQENVPSWFAAWLPNIAFGALGLLWLRKLE